MSAGVDWRRLGGRVAVAAMAAFAAVSLIHVGGSDQYGFDFRGGTWTAARAFLDGTNPYPAAVPAHLLHVANGFITPPVMAVPGIPLAPLSFAPAVIVWNVACLMALLGALWLLGARDRVSLVVAACSFAFISSLELGQPDGMFALLAALAWRYRDRTRGAVAVGLLIAAKLLAWPLLLWLLATRRYRASAVALGTGVAALSVSWAGIGFHGLASYPRLLAADAHAYEDKSHSLVSALIRSSVGAPAARLLALVIALACGALVVRMSRRRDLGWFTGALLTGLLSSPVMWSHYLVLLLVPLALGGRLRDPRVWLALGCLWLSPVESPPTLWQTWLAPAVALALALQAVRARPAAEPELDLRLDAPSHLPVAVRHAEA